MSDTVKYVTLSKEVRLSFDPGDIPDMEIQRKMTPITGMDIRYSFGGVIIDDELRNVCSVSINGYHKLDKPMQACGCHPGVMKTRQHVSRTFHDASRIWVPAWMAARIHTHLPEWW